MAQQGKSLIPSPLTDTDLARTLRLAEKHGFMLEQVLFGMMRVRAWCDTTQSRRADWPMVIINALEAGWALRGYGAWIQRGMATRHLGKLRLHPTAPFSVSLNREGRHLLTPQLQGWIVACRHGAPKATPANGTQTKLRLLTG